jgi:hypothetical protein
MKKEDPQKTAAPARRKRKEAPPASEVTSAGEKDAAPGTRFDASSFVGAALRDARVSRRDARGLMPLAEARRIMEATAAFEKGEGKMVSGTFVLQSDRVWAALLSLENADEFVRHARRIRWSFHVRGRDNTAPFERYGEEILPWLDSRMRDDGVLENIPWCVVPCLLATGSRGALALALRATSVHEFLPEGAPPSREEPGKVRDARRTREDDDDEEEERDDEDERDDDDDDDEAAANAESWSDELGLARRWMAHHPEAYSTLAELADAGDARAADLLRDRARALGGVVRDALVQALGHAEAERIAARFSLPRAELPEGVEALLAGAETIDEPRGPLWSIAELDAAARSFELPLWDNANYTTAAMRITGYASRAGDALIIEHVYVHPSGGVLVGWDFMAFGPGAKRQSGSEELVDPKADELDNVEIGDDYVDGITNQITLLAEEEEEGVRIVPLPLPQDRMIVHVRHPGVRAKGDAVRVSYRLPRSFAALPEEERARLRLVTPGEGLLVDLCHHRRDAMFAQDRELRAAAGVPEGAVKLFCFDDFEYVELGEPASKSPDLVAMAEALRARRRITRLPGKPNARPELWLPRCAELRSFAGGDAWAVGDDPIEPEPPPNGVGVTPYWSLSIARGFPHGVLLLHGPGWNKKGQAEKAVPYLLGASQPAIRVSWPRRTACLWARACSMAERKWAAGDRGVVAAMKNDRMLHTAEAAQLVEAFVLRTWSPPPHVGAELVGILEALVGGGETITAFAAALARLSAGAWSKDHPALACAVFELGFVLRRAEGARGPLRDRLASVLDPKRTNDVARSLDLAVNGRAGAERSARTELDYAHSLDDVAWARERLVSPRTLASPPDVFLVWIGGEGLLAKYEARISQVGDAAWVGSQLARLGSPRAASMVLALFSQRPDMQATLAQSFLERPDARAELDASLRGPYAKAARTLLAVLDQKESDEYARRDGKPAKAKDDEDDEDDEDDDEDDEDEDEDEDDG